MVSRIPVQAFKAQAEALAPGGDLSPEAAAQLNEMSEKMGLSQEKAQKIIRGITNKKLVGNLQDLQSSGQLTLARVRARDTLAFEMSFCLH